MGDQAHQHSIIGLVKHTARFIFNFATGEETLFSGHLSDQWQGTEECKRTLRQLVKDTDGRRTLSRFGPSKAITPIADATAVEFGAVSEKECPVVFISDLPDSTGAGYS